LKLSEEGSKIVISMLYMRVVIMEEHVHELLRLLHRKVLVILAHVGVYSVFICSFWDKVKIEGFFFFEGNKIEGLLINNN